MEISLVISLNFNDINNFLFPKITPYPSLIYETK